MRRPLGSILLLVSLLAGCAAKPGSAAKAYAEKPAQHPYPDHQIRRMYGIPVYCPVCDTKKKDGLEAEIDRR